MSNDQQEVATVAFEVREGIAWVKFNRPDKRNCMNPKLNRRMLQVLRESGFPIKSRYEWGNVEVTFPTSLSPQPPTPNFTWASQTSGSFAAAAGWTAGVTPGAANNAILNAPGAKKYTVASSTWRSPGTWMPS